MSNRGGFFAVDRRCWAKACKVGMNAAVAYLMHARGTGRDQLTSAWSVQAIEKYTGISRSRAKRAIRALQEEGLTTSERKGTHPRYRLRPRLEVTLDGKELTAAQSDVLQVIAAGEQPTARQRSSVNSLLRRQIIERDADGKLVIPKPKWIWLPNEFVTGAATETPPLELLRQSQDVMALRLAVDLYYAQNLREDGGVNRNVTWRKYDRFEVGQRAQFAVWGFCRSGEWMSWGNETTKPHYREERHLTREEKKAGKDSAVDFFPRMHLLADIGIVEWVPCLLEGNGDDAEIIHPLAVSNDEPDRLENRIGTAAHWAGQAMLTDGQRKWADLEGFSLVPVPRHLSNVQVVGVARLRHRPKTKLTAAWWADLNNNGEEWVQRYAQLGRPTVVSAAS